MDASVLENQLKQRLRRPSSRQDLGVGSNPPSRPDSSEPPAPGASLVLNTSSAIEGDASVVSRSELSTPRTGDLPPLPQPQAAAGGKLPITPTGMQSKIETSERKPPITPTGTLQKGETSESLPSLNASSSSNALLKKAFLPEAPPIDLVLPGPIKPLVEASKKTAVETRPAAAEKEGFTSDEDDGFSKGSEGDEQEDEWDTESSTAASEEHIQRFASLIGSIRAWFAENGLSLQSAPRTLKAELDSGIMLCKLLSKISKQESIMGGVILEYSPALATLNEWKNLEHFFVKAREVYPKLADFVCGPKDIYNNMDVPNFLCFLFLLAQSAGKQLDTISNHEQATSGDVALLKKQKPEKLANALTVIDEDEHRKSSPVYSWLKEMRLEMYFGQFERQGWEDMEKVSLIEEGDLRAMGIEKDGHIKYILARVGELNYLREVLLTSRMDNIVQFDDAPSPASSLSEKPTPPLTEEFSEALRAVHHTLRSFPELDGLRDMCDVATHLVSSAIALPALVVDVSSSGQAVVGLAGSLSPLMEIPLENADVLEAVKRGIAKVNTLGVPTSKRVFLVGVTATRVLYEDLLKLAPKGCFVCNPKSTAVLSLRSCGLSDGVSLDVDVLKVARAIAVNASRAIPQGFVTEVIKDAVTEEDTAKREKVLLGMVSSSLSECGFAQSSKRVRGGLVVTGTRLPLTPGVVKRFSAGLFNVAPVARWSAASQVAIHPDFQHRWMLSSPAKPQEEMLFPLISSTRRREITAKACRAATHLGRVLRLKEEAARLDELNARNASSPHFTTFTSPSKASRQATTAAAASPPSPMSSLPATQPAKPPKSAPPARPPPPLHKRSQEASREGTVASPLSSKSGSNGAAGHQVKKAGPLKGNGTEIPIVDAHVNELMNHVTRKDVIDAFRTFLLQDCAENQGKIAKQGFGDVLKVLSPELRKLLRQGGFIFLDKDEGEGSRENRKSGADEDSDVLMEML